MSRILGVQSPPEWGIEPVPVADRRLRARDLAVLWGSLGVGLLVIETGTFLAGLGLARALAAVVVGSLVGVTLLAAAGRIGAAEGLPSMVLVRPVLGIRGAYLPSALNVVQLVGWAAFELWVMGTAAAVIGERALGGRAALLGQPRLWILLFALVATLLALGGPLAVVRQWLEKFGVWVMLAASLWLTYHLLASLDLAALWNQPGDPAGFWSMVDLVIAMPVSWLPLVADYNRFARTPAGGFRGTFAGYLVANVWFYLLGVLAVLAARLDPAPSPAALAAALALLGGGGLALVAILVDEIDNVFADIYSAAVSIQNVAPRLSQRALIVAIGALGALLAVAVEIGDYFNFLLLVGSVFVPLFGLLLADYFVVRRGRGYDPAELYRPGGRYWFAGGFNGPAIGVWLAGIAAFHWAAGALPIGGSLPAFALTAVLYVTLARFGITGTGPDRPPTPPTPVVSDNQEDPKNPA